MFCCNNNVAFVVEGKTRIRKKIKERMSLRQQTNH